MSGLVTRLQKQAERGTYIPDGPKLILEAIAEIESLRSRLVIESKAREGREALLRENESLRARLAEAIECCTIKDNRNLWLEIRLKKIMARCADLLDEDQFNELDALARATDSKEGL